MNKLSDRKATKCIREYLWAFKGTVGVLSVASGRRYCLGTTVPFARNPPNLQNYGFGKDCNPTCLNANSMYWRYRDARLPSPTGVRGAEVLRYCGAISAAGTLLGKVKDSYCLTDSHSLYLNYSLTKWYGMAI